MAAITSTACYLPKRRMALPLLSGGSVQESSPVRTVAWCDEDSLTMAVEAGRSCLRKIDKKNIDAIIFSTTSYAYSEKQAAATIAKAIGLPVDILALDIAHSLRGGTQALIAAADMVSAQSVNKVLVIASDCRLGAPGSAIEVNSGDAAVAFVVEEHGAIEFVHSASRHNEILDVWRRSGERFVHQWEDRFVKEHGYLENCRLIIEDFLKSEAQQADNIDHFILSAPDQRSHKTLISQLGLNNVVDPLFGRVGQCGVAHALLQLIIAIDEASTGQTLLLSNYGDGADLIAFRVRELVGKSNFITQIQNSLPVKSLEQYQKAKEFVIEEYEGSDFQGISATIHFRERDENIAFEGRRCDCGSAQFPRQRICVQCGEIDKNSIRESFSDRQGKLITYTQDAFFPSPEPPTSVGIVEIDHGPRVYLQLTDVMASDVSINMPLKFCFRKIHSVGGRPNYFWKAQPLDLV